MKKDLQVFNFKGNDVREITDENNNPWFVAKDVADILGYSKPRNAINEHCKGALKQGILTSMGIQQMLIIPESDLYRLIIKSKLPEAEKFEKWVMEEVLPSIRKTGSYSIKPPATPEIEKFLLDKEAGRWVIEELRLSDTGKMLIMKDVFENNNINTNILPDYTDEKLTQSLSSLLKENEINISATKVNRILEENNIIERKYRKSSKGNDKSFWSLTDKGLNYGKNLINPNNQKETQPHYYVNNFSDLMDTAVYMNMNLLNFFEMDKKII